MTPLPPHMLDSILAKPEDDLPRLIASDWFEENGASELAEFIRRQIANPDSRIDNCMGDGATGLNCPYDGGKLCPHCDDLQKESGFPASLFGEGKVFFRRGFPDEIHTTLREWVGAECDRCLGRRYVALDDVARPEYAEDYTRCPKCHGTGRLPGIAGRVCGQWPVTSVILSDVGPSQYPFRSWAFSFEVTDVFETPNYSYRSKETALAALSDAAIRYGRRLAGLPELRS